MRKFFVQTTGARYGSAIPSDLPQRASVGNRFLESSTNRFLSKQTGFPTYEFCVKRSFSAHWTIFCASFLCKPQARDTALRFPVFAATCKCRNRFLESSTNRFLSKQTGFPTYEFLLSGLFRPTGPFFAQVFVQTTGARYGSAIPSDLPQRASVGNRFLESSTNRFLSKQTGFPTYEFCVKRSFSAHWTIFCASFCANHRRAIRLCDSQCICRNVQVSGTAF